MSTFESTAEAHRVARERASVAAALEASTLHTAIYDAREAGMSVREAAAALDVSKSTVSRHWREGHRCTAPVPVWGSETAWREAHAAIWAHDPHEAADDFVPYEWIEEGGQRTIRARWRGVAVLGQQDSGR
ncbi:helix-turn-helix domain-containing protein [Agrococcus casei]|uniref:helix-turn-helix domain-containing protein n=1 Tax=Agrococcus casei TaxID=343512 RepID=UPI001178B636